MKYAVCIYSRYSGDHIFLGSKHASHDAALAYAEKEVCDRCYRYEIIHVDDGHIYAGRREGWKQVLPPLS